MKVYIDENDIGKTVTYKDENGKRQYLYIHDNEGFIFKELSEHDKQVRKEVCEEIRKYIPRCSGMDMVIILDDTHTLNTILDQIQGDENNE